MFCLFCINSCLTIQQLNNGEIKIARNPEEEGYLRNVVIPEVDDQMRKLGLLDYEDEDELSVATTEMSKLSVDHTAKNSTPNENIPESVPMDVPVPSSSRRFAGNEKVIRIPRDLDHKATLAIIRSRFFNKPNPLKFLRKEPAKLSGGIQQKFDRPAPFKHSQAWKLTDTFRRDGRVQCFNCSKFDHVTKHCKTPPLFCKPFELVCPMCGFRNKPGLTRNHAVGCMFAK
jgi:hypothetical protein